MCVMQSLGFAISVSEMKSVTVFDITTGVRVCLFLRQKEYEEQFVSEIRFSD